MLQWLNLLIKWIKNESSCAQFDFSNSHVLLLAPVLPVLWNKFNICLFKSGLRSDLWFQQSE